MSSSGIYPALSGAVVENHALEMVASNLANASTASFRAQRLSFQETLVRARGTRPDQRFVKTAEMLYDMSPGSLRFTGVSTDVALSGPGFIAVRTPAGERYIRGGSLSRGSDGRVLTSLGHQLISANDEPLTTPPGRSLRIGQNGEVMVDDKVVAQLKLREFNRPQALRGEGGGVYAASAADPGTAAKQTQIIAEHLEGANVNPLRAMTDVISASRHYEALHRVIETYREIDTTAARELASVS